MDIMEVLGSFVAGLGLFFIGIKTLTTHLGELTGKRFRRLLDRPTRVKFMLESGAKLVPFHSSSRRVGIPLSSKRA